MSKREVEPEISAEAIETESKAAKGKSLVVVESPTKAKTISKYLGSGYVIKFSLGHVKDLPKKTLGVDLEKDFRATYEVIPTKKKVISELRAAAKSAKDIYLAADTDREGEAICAHLAEELGDKKHSKKIHRVLFHEITKAAVQAAMANPIEIDTNRVDAQQTRRILDRLVGYKVSPLLWDKVRRGISAGRVQTVALRIIVEREAEIRAFQKREYWTIDADLEAGSPPAFTARLIKKAGETIDIVNEAQARALEAEIHALPFVVTSVTTREKRRNASPPFITSKLQQDASRKLHFSVKRTMVIAQRLYEGIELGAEGPVGLITYMRTDSVRVSDTAVAEARTYIGRDLGAAYLPPQPNFYKTKKDAQDAHEAIRPTMVDHTPDSIAKYLSEDELKLYRLIWQRFVASQMLPAIFDQTSIDINAGDNLFRATGSVMKFDGFLKVYEEAKDSADEEDEERKHTLPPVTEGEPLRMSALKPEQHFTEPPPRFNEATLVKDLEEKGIGRPSTYASILSVIQDREYVEKRANRFYPTELGTVVCTLLVDNFADIFDLAYTARMEEELDEIEEGKLPWVAALEEFYGKFAKDLELAKRNMVDIKRMERTTDQVCEKCGKPMVIKWGRHGSFIACTGYPECTNTRELDAHVSDLPEGEVSANAEDRGLCVNCGRPMQLKRGQFGQFLACTGYPDCKTTQQLGQAQRKPDVMLEEECPKCNSKLVVRDGRFGEFTACSSYPKCKYVKHKTMGVACPNPGCTGELAERRSKRGKTFYGCINYPNCDFVTWNRPLLETCPDCGSPYLEEKRSKAGVFKVCPNKECKFKVEVEESDQVPAEVPA